MKTSLALCFVMMTAASAAYADQVNLVNLDTNNYDQCMQIANEVNLLSNVSASVSSTCEGPGYFVSNQGEAYSFRVASTVNTYSPLYMGESLGLANLDTNNPDQLLNDLAYLNGGNNPVVLNLEGPGYFVSSQGVAYSYRIQTSLITN